MSVILESLKYYFIIIMENNSLVLVIHSLCPASVSIHNKFEANNIKVDVINLEYQEVEARIEVDMVPLLIINNNKVLKGKAVFDYIDELVLSKSVLQSNGKKKTNLYSNLYIAPPDSGSKKTPVKLE